MAWILWLMFVKCPGNVEEKKETAKQDRPFTYSCGYCQRQCWVGKLRRRPQRFLSGQRLDRQEASSHREQAGKPEGYSWKEAGQGTEGQNQRNFLPGL